VHVAKAGDEAELAHRTEVPRLLQSQLGDTAAHAQPVRKRVREQPVMPAPALERHAERRGTDGRTAQYAVNARRETALEPAEGLVVELLHCRARDGFHLRCGDVSVPATQQSWRDLCLLQ